jgi:hypothetical protein
MHIQPIVTWATREAIKENEYGGFTIPKGWKVRVVENNFMCCVS